MAAGRKVAEWIGKTKDTPIPPRVRARVFMAHKGICHVSKRKILPGDEWDCDHIQPLEDDGENRESNLAPALKAPHRQKTAKENHQRGIDRRKAKKHLGITKPASKFSKRGREINALARELHGQPGFERMSDARAEAERRLG